VDNTDDDVVIASFLSMVSLGRLGVMADASLREAVGGGGGSTCGCEPLPPAAAAVVVVC